MKESGMQWNIQILQTLTHEQVFSNELYLKIKGYMLNKLEYCMRPY